MELNKSSMCSTELQYPKYMMFCVVISSLGFFCNGWVTGSANLPGSITHACENGDAHTQNRLFPDCLPMNEALWGFAVASFCVGGLFGAMSGGYIQTEIGRRKTMIFNGIGFIVGGLLIGCSVNPGMFILGRIICGYSCGITTLTIPIYVGEISTIKARGALNVMYQMMQVTSILISSLVGIPFSYVPLWRINYALVAVPAIIMTTMMPFCTESPRYLVSINKIEEAKISLQRLRPNSDISLELYDIVKAQLGTVIANAIIKNIDATTTTTTTTTTEIQKMDGEITFDDQTCSDDTVCNSSLNIFQVWTNPFIRKILLIIISLNSFQQLVGINAVMYYSTSMFNQLFDENLSKYLAIACTGVNFVSTVAALFLVDSLGRKIILEISLVGICVTTILLTIGYVFNLGPLMVVSIFCYIISFAFGIGPIPWMLVSELSPVYASSAIGSIGVGMNWAMNFLVGQCFPLIFSSIKGYSFLIFTTFGILALAITIFRVPETKGRSIEDIIQDFKGAKY